MATEQTEQSEQDQEQDDQALAQALAAREITRRDMFAAQLMPHYLQHPNTTIEQGAVLAWQAADALERHRSDAQAN